MLDSSPVALPPIPRPLKRSASTASLPTPPRTHRKLARGRSRGSCDSDSDKDVVSTSDDEVMSSEEKTRKKRRIGEEAKQVDEDTFWLTNPAAAVLSSPPVTPKTRSSVRRALRDDSPDNPFLTTSEPHVEETPTNPNIPHGPLQERPTITYVFRGVRRECKNPFYDHVQGRPFSPPPESKLPFDHPDYSPAAHCTPKRLFVDTRPKRKKPATALSRMRARQRSPSLSDDESEVGEIRPLKLDFGPPEKKELVLKLWMIENFGC